MELGKLHFYNKKQKFNSDSNYVFSLDYVHVCDGKLDCKDASDENLCAKVLLNDGYTFLHSDPDNGKYNGNKSTKE